MKKYLIPLFLVNFLIFSPVYGADLSVTNRTPAKNPCDKKIVPDDVYADFRAALNTFLESGILGDIEKQINDHTDSDAKVPIEIYVDDLEGFKKQYAEDTSGLNPPGTAKDAENIYNRHTAYTYLTDTAQNGVQVIKVKFFCKDDLRIRTIDNNASGGWDLYEQIIHEFVHVKLYALLALGVKEEDLPFKDHDDDSANDNKEDFFKEVKRLLDKLIVELKKKGLVSSSLIQQSETITSADLGVESAGILPTNPFYFLKEWGRGVRLFFTFNSVAKASLELQVVNQKAAELKGVEENKPDDAKAIQNAIENYQESQARLKTRLESLRETSQNPNVDRLLDQLADRTVKHEKLMDDIAEKFQDRTEVQNLVRDTKEKIEDSAAAGAKKDDPAKFVSKLEKALIESRGSEVKHVRSVEILDRLEQRAPENLKESLERLRQDFSERLRRDLDEFIVKSGSDTAQAAIADLPGDGAKRSVLLEEVREKAEKRVAEVLDKAAAVLERSARDEKNIAEKAVEQIRSAEEKILKLESGIKESASAQKVVKNLLAEAQNNLKEAKTVFEEKKYGEAFGQARSAEVLARNGLRFLEEKEPYNAEDLKKELQELLVKIGKAEELVKFHGYTEQGYPKLYALLSESRRHWNFAQEALDKNDLEGAKLHMSHVKGFLDDIYRILETEKRSAEVLPVRLRPAETSAARPLASRCDVWKQRQEELDKLFDGGKISESDYYLKSGIIKKELTVCEPREPAPAPVPVREAPSTEIFCTQEYNLVCGVNGKTYSNECYAKVAGVAIQYKGGCRSSSIEPKPTATEQKGDTESTTVTPTSAPTIVAPAIYEFKIEADDRSFYPEPTLTVPKGVKVKIYFTVRTENVYYGGLDFRSSKFNSASAKPGGIATVEFLADESFTFSSYWPATGVLKATGKVVVQ